MEIGSKPWFSGHSNAKQGSFITPYWYRFCGREALQSFKIAPQLGPAITAKLATTEPIHT
jgi:hypothetical protein